MSKSCELLGVKTQFGNNVSHSQRKTRRRFDVNLQNISLKSEALDREFKFKVAASTIRTVDHNGGLDSFLLTTKANKLTDKALKIKREIRKVAAQ